MTTPMYEARMKICRSCEFFIEDSCALCGCEPAVFAQDPNEKCRATPERWPAQVNPSVAETINRTVCIPCQKNK